ncbi:extracellular solute-binding protein [Maritimibacter sp. DP1N21-5]|uniref:extracellular solute-binding protein n=1 Tax=Maritimibacter sp. DP1N21-5 TaxID=2836867 RepID=UPI001C47CF75|nr:extracellular solute-binding protein [Maritimibacter sp. DP1N21-5]MBV7408496.1 extracellular solute-binding protein [Maritimibacter sp. DP1N21-5]
MTPHASRRNDPRNPAPRGQAQAATRIFSDLRSVALTLALSGAVVLAGTIIARGQDAGQDAQTTVTHAYSNFGEVKYGPDFPHLDYVNPDAPKGGEISISSMGTFDSFNQYSRKGVPAALNTIGSEAILAATADDAYSAYCLLCTTMEYPEDLKWVTFNLRDDVTFSDGTPMTAEDVLYSFNLFLEQGITEYRAIVEGFIEGVEVLDPHTITFTFTDQAPIRERITFAGGTPVFSKAWFEETGQRLDESSDQPFMSTGAYVLDSFDYNRQIIYKRNPDYWGADHPLQIGQSNFDTIRVEYFADSQAAFEAFKAGAFTFREENSSLIWATGYENFPNLQDGHVIKTEFADGTVGTAQSFVFNLDRPTWQDKRVRDAIGMMFNFEWSNEALFYGLYSRVNSFWPGSELAATGTPSEAEVALLQPLVDEGLLDAAILAEEAPEPPVNAAAQNRPDRGMFRQAGALLAEAGWEPGSDGKLRKDGQMLDLVIVSYDPSFDRIINPYIENLQQLGVNAKLERVDTAQYVERRRAGEFDMVSHGFSMGFEPGIDLEQWFASKTADDSSRNLMRLRSEAVDKLIPAVVAAKDLDELQTAVHALDRVLRSIGFMVPQWFKPVYTVAYYDQYEHPENMPPYALGYMDFWWYDEAKHDALVAAGVLR